jgi:predicted RNase H-like HicB family nuclease
MPEYQYTIVLHPDAASGGYGVEVPALPGCFTQGHTREEALERAQEAIAAHLAGLVADGESIPIEQQRPELAIVRVAA